MYFFLPYVKRFSINFTASRFTFHQDPKIVKAGSNATAYLIRLALFVYDSGNEI